VKEIDHEYTNKIVCPYCGYSDVDSCGYEDDDIGLIDCESCGKSFYAYRSVTIAYSTEKPRRGKCSICGKEDAILENYSSSMGSFKDACLKCKDKKIRGLVKKYFENLDKWQNDERGGINEK